MSVRLDTAIMMAAQAHAGQLDKSGEAYILHPLRVMNAVRHFGEDAMIIAVLHDVVEDCGILLSNLRIIFGDEIADGVDSVSRRGFEPKEIYREFIRRADQNRLGREVKIADIKDNLSRLGKLSADEADFLRKRYEGALAFLESE